jgi:hypothetical protein
MKALFVKVGTHVMQLGAIVDAHWERERLFVHFDGGRFAQLDGEAAELVWKAVQEMTVDLQTGEIGARVDQ